LEFIFLRLFGLSDDHDNHFAVTALLGVALLLGFIGDMVVFLKNRFIHGALLFHTCSSHPACIRKIRFRALEVCIQANFIAWLVIVAPLSSSSFTALYMAAASTLTYDTGLYHAQSIRWIESYPASPAWRICMTGWF